MSDTRHPAATAALVALDGVVGLLIGGSAIVLVRLVFAETAYTWLFGIALLFVMMGAGLFRRFQSEPGAAQDGSRPKPAAMRGFAFNAGLVIGAVIAMLRLSEITPP